MTDHGTSDREIDAVMRASRALIAVVATSLADVEQQVTPAQLRVLVLIASRGPQTLGSVAEDLKVHASNASRTCDRLVAARMIERGEIPTDRRFLQLRLTDTGTHFLAGLMAHRRGALAEIVARMPAEDRRELGTVMESFAEAAGEPSDEALPAVLGLGFP
ncbi:MarR family winged helix-turn-helix transcriptional regulator [Arthrobacter sp. CAN_A2]|uniref:MarR family winged helix-turn-helix transcriptional regulator n=1 Tax=Arthrobacter sp. CAN_A2 TaxID=2787718 RepID=UPI002FEE9442